MDQSIPKAVRSAFTRARKRACKKTQPFDLTEDDLLGLWQRSAGRCEITGIQFDLEGVYKTPKAHHYNPWTPSIDRLDNGAGYAIGNCRLVVAAANFGMNTWGEHVLFTMAHAIVGRAGFDTPFDQGPPPVHMPRGVTREGSGAKPYRVRIRPGHKLIHIGCYATLSEATEALRLARIRHTSVTNV